MKVTGNGPVVCLGSFDVFERAELSPCHARHTQQIVSQTRLIHQGPTVLALCPVKLLTSEATSRNMRPAEGGQGRGRGGGGGSWRGVEEKRETDKVWICHILVLLSTWALWSSFLLCRYVDSSSQSLHFLTCFVYTVCVHARTRVCCFNNFHQFCWCRARISNFSDGVQTRANEACANPNMDPQTSQEQKKTTSICHQCSLFTWIIKLKWISTDAEYPSINS